MTVQQAFQLAGQHHQAGRLKEAEALYRQILSVQPNHAEAAHRFGVLADQVGRHDLAIEWIRYAVALNPHDSIAHSNLGAALARQGRLDEAIACYRHALAIKPGYAEVHYNLGDSLRALGQFDEAVAEFRHALALNPANPDAHNNLGISLAAQGHFDEAIAAYRRALQVKPGYARAWYNLGNVFRDQGLWDEAIAAWRRTLELQADYVLAQSNLLYALLFHPVRDPATVTAEQERWNRLFSDSLRPRFLPHGNERSPERRLRIGYVSPEFRDHVTGHYLLPLFESHDRTNFEIVCYSGVRNPDHVTAQFRAHADQWRSTVGMSDDALAAAIRQDGVDILVDLTQHMEGNRLPVFARQPAPVQVSFAGYPESTGLGAIGYRISDRFLESASLAFPNSDHETVCLIDTFWCYHPCGGASEANTLPARTNGRVTFGSLNNFSKINEPVLRLWTRVMAAVKDSRLVLLQRPEGTHRSRILEFFAREGIDRSRVEFAAPRPRQAYLDLYHDFEIALDPFPYNGHTTSLDALWMGLPVVTLAGDTPVSRGGLSILSNLGLPELVAASLDDYVRIAADLAADLPRLSDLRRTLRPRMQTSPLMDAPRFARGIEAAYRTVWRRWCATTPSTFP